MRKKTADQLCSELRAGLRRGLDAIGRALDQLTPEHIQCHDNEYADMQLCRAWKEIATVSLTFDGYEVSDEIVERAVLDARP